MGALRRMGWCDVCARFSRSSFRARRMIEAARLKAVHPIALADAFAIATAAAHGRILLTGDPEIIGRADLPCAVEDLR